MFLEDYCEMKFFYKEKIWEGGGRFWNIALLTGYKGWMTAKMEPLVTYRD